MRYLLRVSLIAILFSGTAACSTGTETKNMQVGAIQNADFGKYKSGITVTGVDLKDNADSRIDTGNFKEALRNSLASNGLLNDSVPYYKVDVHIVKVVQPQQAFDARVTTAVQYVIWDTKNGKIVTDKTIETRSTVTKVDAPLQVKRERIAYEQALQDNIELFIDYLRR